MTRAAEFQALTADLFGLIPTGDHVILKRDAAETHSPGGIILAEISRERPHKGVVLAVGPGRLLDSGVRVPIGVEPGDTVYYARHRGTEIEVRGVELTVLKGEDVLCREEEEEPDLVQTALGKWVPRDKAGVTCSLGSPAEAEA